MAITIYYDCGEGKWAGHPSPGGVPYSVLDEMSSDLLLIDSFTFTLEFYTDCLWDSLFNRNYTQMKADSAVAYLGRRTFNRIALTGIGFGEDSLVNDCSCEIKNGEKKDGTYRPCNPEELQKNRRMVLRITGIRKD